MNRCTNQVFVSLQFANNVKYKDRNDYDYDDEPSYSQRPSKNRSDEDHEYRKVTKEKLADPADSSRGVFNFFKRISLSKILFITGIGLGVITGIGLCIASICYIRIGVLTETQQLGIDRNYFADVMGISGIFGSIAGIIVGFFFLILMIVNLKKMKGKILKTFMGFIAIVVITLLLIYFLFVACSQIGLDIGSVSLSYKSDIIREIITNISSVVITFNTGKCLGNIIEFFYYVPGSTDISSIDIIIGGAGFLVINLIILLFGGLYFRFINQVGKDTIPNQ